jgi:hypothetical protein
MPRKSKFLDDKTVNFDEETTERQPGPAASSATATATGGPARASRSAHDAVTIDDPIERGLDTLTDQIVGQRPDVVSMPFEEASHAALDQAEAEFDARETTERPRPRGRRKVQQKTTVIGVKRGKARRPSTDDEDTKVRG